MSENKTPEIEETDVTPDLVSLTDEDGKEYSFELLDAIETDEAKYIALLPQYDSPEALLNDSGELVILKVFEDDEGEYYEEIEDDDEFDTIADAFMERLQDFYEIDEGSVQS